MQLEHICKGIADWLDRAGESERELALVALQVTVEATKDEATVSGGLPVDHPPFITNKQSSRCSSSGEYYRLPIHYENRLLRVIPT